MRSVLALLIALAACGAPSNTPGRTLERPLNTGQRSPLSSPAGPNRSALPEYLDCIREAGGLLIAAHRGGPAPGFPENAIETMANGLANGLFVFEVDVAESRDGVLFLHHDRSLTRTTTGRGPVVDADWTEIRRLNLKDGAGAVTGFSPATLADALAWAVENRAILELDRKESTSFRNIIAAVREAGADDHVIVITYTEDQAATVHSVAPDLVISAGARGARDLAALKDRGVVTPNVLGWTGTSDPDPAAWARLGREGVEPAFGTLGRPGDRLDDAYWADGDGSEYADLVADGLVLLATDEPVRVADALEADDAAREACGR